MKRLRLDAEHCAVYMQEESTKVYANGKLIAHRNNIIIQVDLLGSFTMPTVGKLGIYRSWLQMNTGLREWKSKNLR